MHSKEKILILLILFNIYDDVFTTKDDGKNENINPASKQEEEQMVENAQRVTAQLSQRQNLSHRFAADEVSSSAALATAEIASIGGHPQIPYGGEHQQHTQQRQHIQQQMQQAQPPLAQWNPPHQQLIEPIDLQQQRQEQLPLQQMRQQQQQRGRQFGRQLSFGVNIPEIGQQQQQTPLDVVQNERGEERREELRNVEEQVDETDPLNQERISRVQSRTLDKGKGIAFEDEGPSDKLGKKTIDSSEPAPRREEPIELYQRAMVYQQPAAEGQQQQQQRFQTPIGPYSPSSFYLPRPTAQYPRAQFAPAAGHHHPPMAHGARGVVIREHQQQQQAPFFQQFGNPTFGQNMARQQHLDQTQRVNQMQNILDQFFHNTIPAAAERQQQHPLPAQLAQQNVPSSAAAVELPSIVRIVEIKEDQQQQQQKNARPIRILQVPEGYIEQRIPIRDGTIELVAFSPYITSPESHIARPNRPWIIPAGKQVVQLPMPIATMPDVAMPYAVALVDAQAAEADVPSSSASPSTFSSSLLRRFIIPGYFDRNKGPPFGDYIGNAHGRARTPPNSQLEELMPSVSTELRGRLLLKSIPIPPGMTFSTIEQQRQSRKNKKLFIIMVKSNSPQHLHRRNLKIPKFHKLKMIAGKYGSSDVEFLYFLKEEEDSNKKLELERDFFIPENKRIVLVPGLVDWTFVQFVALISKQPQGNLRDSGTIDKSADVGKTKKGHKGKEKMIDVKMEKQPAIEKIIFGKQQKETIKVPFAGSIFPTSQQTDAPSSSFRQLRMPQMMQIPDYNTAQLVPIAPGSSLNIVMIVSENVARQHRQQQQPNIVPPPVTAASPAGSTGSVVSPFKPPSADEPSAEQPQQQQPQQQTQEYKEEVNTEEANKADEEKTAGMGDDEEKSKKPKLFGVELKTKNEDDEEDN